MEICYFTTLFNVTELHKASIDIEVSAKPQFEGGRRVPGANLVFSYTIEITNHSNEVVKLLSRQWYINDGGATVREVSGEGVIGEQPILGPQDSFSYQSWCPLKNKFGVMSGYYTFINVNTHQTFNVTIQPFLLLPDYQLN